MKYFQCFCICIVNFDKLTIAIITFIIIIATVMIMIMVVIVMLMRKMLIMIMITAMVVNKCNNDVIDTNDNNHINNNVNNLLALLQMGCPPRIPGNATLFYEISIISFVDACAADAFEEQHQQSATFQEKLEGARGYHRKVSA